ncbi:hypothetical protein GG496_000630, partial [Candidatus Fervidibacteria bacterium JGI MDM2 JNZ-1-D12]
RVFSGRLSSAPTQNDINCVSPNNHPCHRRGQAPTLQVCRKIGKPEACLPRFVGAHEMCPKNWLVNFFVRQRNLPTKVGAQKFISNYGLKPVAWVEKASVVPCIDFKSSLLSPLLLCQRGCNRERQFLSSSFQPEKSAAISSLAR